MSYDILVQIFTQNGGQYDPLYITGIGSDYEEFKKILSNRINLTIFNLLI